MILQNDLGNEKCIQNVFHPSFPIEYTKILLVYTITTS